MTPLQTTIRFRMNSCSLYLFEFSNLHVLLKRSHRKLEPWSVRICAGSPNFSTMFNTNSCAIVSASCWGVGSATRNFLLVYLFPSFAFLITCKIYYLLVLFHVWHLMNAVPRPCCLTCHQANRVCPGNLSMLEPIASFLLCLNVLTLIISKSLSLCPAIRTEYCSFCPKLGQPHLALLMFPVYPLVCH